MPVIAVKPDTLGAENRHFVQAELREPVFLNSVPKSGSHLLRNILRMFVPSQQQYQAQFIQWGNLQEHRAAFDRAAPKLSWGHLFFSDGSAIETAAVRKILLVRDPYDWVLARARFFVSEEFKGNVEHLKSGSLSVAQLLNLMIVGIRNNAPSLYDVYYNNAAAWLGTDVYVVRYEDILAALADIDSTSGAEFFADLLTACGIAKPVDWQARVMVGADPKHSATSRQNLTSADIAFPAQLPEMQKRLADLSLPGLRAMFGYQ